MARQSQNAFDALPRFAAPPGGRLDDAMLAAYRDAGVLILEGFVSAGECQALRKRALELATACTSAGEGSVFSTTGEEQLDDSYFIESGDKIRCFFEAESTDASAREHPVTDRLNKMGHAMHDLDSEFSRFSRRPELAEIAGRIGLDDPVILQSMYIFKPPRIGGEVLCHQDSTYIYTEPESCTGFWFAIDDATVENGCMQFIPGAHRGPLKRRNYRVSDTALRTDTLDPSPWPEDARLPAEAESGALVLFTGRTPHMSEANRSERPRHAYTLHAIDRVCHYPPSNWLKRSPALPLTGFAAAAAN